MPTSDSPNPYQVTFLEDEKPEKQVVEEIRFVRRKPMPRKLTGTTIRRYTRQTFRRRPWRFIGLGLMQWFFGFVMFYASIFLVQPLTHYIIPDALAPASWFGSFLFFEFLGYAIVVDGAIRLLRDKKIFRKNPQNTLRQFKTWGNCFCYGLICLLMLLPAWVFLIDAGIFEMKRTDNMFLSSLWLAAGFILFVPFGMFVFGRYEIGLHYIVDREVGFRTALRRTANYTRGNGFSIAMSFCLHCVLLIGTVFLTVFGAGYFLGLDTIEMRPPYMEIFFYFLVAVVVVFGPLPIVAYLHCWLAVTYHLTTGQYEIPYTTETQGETQEW